MQLHTGESTVHHPARARPRPWARPQRWPRRPLPPLPSPLPVDRLLPPLQRHGLCRLVLLAPQAVTAGPELLRGVPVLAGIALHVS